MAKPALRIGLRLSAIGTIDVSKPGNVQGDEQVARAWQKHLLRSNAVRSVTLYDSNSRISDELDVLIHFNPFLQPHEGTKNLLYLQNAFPESRYAGGVIAIFNQVRDRFAGFMFTSRKLMQACCDGAVVPFATDSELFFPQPASEYRWPVAFVGNDIRGGAVNHRYLHPALPLGLVIYGNLWVPPLSSVWRGKLPEIDLPRLYSSVAINLNAHIPEHLQWNTINLRIFDILACGGFVISDESEAVREAFGDSVVCTDGYEDEWAKIVRFSSDPAERDRRADAGRKIVLGEHTYEHRMRDVLDYLHALV